MWRCFAAALLCLGLAACDATGDPDDERPLVVAAFYPLEFAAAQVGGEAVEVTALTPTGVEPHDLELSARQVRDLADADLIVYLGGFQPALDDALADMDPARTFDALAADVPPGENDPHVWLDPTLLAGIAERLAEQLGAIEPSRSDDFITNASELRSGLMQLDREFERGLTDCSSRKLVTSHEAFGYLAARYDLQQVGISGIDPEAEPSPQRLAEVARFVEDNDVHTIFFEELAPPDLAETLATETGAQIDMLSPLETAPRSGDYLDAMRLNLLRLERGLGCG